MDVQAVEMLTKGLHAGKRKGKAPGEGSKKVRIDSSSSVAPTSATATFEIAESTEIVPTIEVGTIDGASVPPTSSSLATKDQVLELPTGGEKRKKRKEKKSTTVKVWCKAHPNELNDDDEDLGENPFYN
ncbi:hypothetical protein COCNU_12G000110 [Cocos nucifera]|uniref:Uncharacterized protein n=1 Tax=Cocos nucifera TaxID=13894 RepID=A0A8K0IR14_COCNU|nr:hypothetical protein COCNU_12G000110 [Cocos nucifera]